MQGLEIESCTGQGVLNVIDDTCLDGVDIFGHVTRHNFVQLVSHSWIGLCRGHSIDWSLEVARLVYMG